MRMIRVSPPELARAFAGPYASISTTRCRRFARCHAVHAPNTPAPITATSNVFWLLTVSASYRNFYPNEKQTVFQSIRRRRNVCTLLLVFEVKNEIPIQEEQNASHDPTN